MKKSSRLLLPGILLLALLVHFAGFSLFAGPGPIPPISFYEGLMKGDLQCWLLLWNIYWRDYQYRQFTMDHAREMAFVDAAGNGKIGDLQRMLDQGIPIDCRDYHGKTALIMAAYCNQLEALQFLLSKGANVHLSYSDGSNAFSSAAMWGFAKIGKVLIEAGCAYERKDLKRLLVMSAGRETTDILEFYANRLGPGEDRLECLTEAFFEAIYFGNMKSLRFLLDQGVDINRKNEKGETPLMLAACHSNDEMLPFFFERGGDIMAKDAAGHSILWYSVAWPVRAERLKIFLAKGLKPDRVVVEKNIREGFYSLLPFLLEVYPQRDLDETDACGETLLFLAVRKGNVNAVKMLAQKGANPNIPNKNGLTIFNLPGGEAWKELFPQGSPKKGP